MPPCSPSPTSPRAATASALARAGDGLRRAASRCSTATPTPTTTAPSSPSPASRAPLRRGAGRRRRGGAGDDRHGAPTRGAHPAIGALDVCPLVWLDPADRDAARTEAVAVAAADRRPRRPGLPLRRAGARPGPGRARLLPQRRPGRALAADGGGRAAARLRPARCRTRAAAPPWSPRGRRWPPSTSSSTAATSRSRARSPPGCASRAAGCRACGRSGCCCRAAAPRSRPTSTTRWRCRWARWSSGCGSWRRRSAPARWRPSWSGSIPAAALDGYPDDVPIRGFDPERHVIERRLAARDRLDSWPMAQTKKKRRRKHRGTQGGRIDTNAALPPAHPRRGESPRPRGKRKPVGPTSRPAADLAQLDQPRPRRRRDLLRPAAAALQTPGRRLAGARRLHARLLHPRRATTST